MSEHVSHTCEQQEMKPLERSFVVILEALGYVVKCERLDGLLHLTVSFVAERRP